MTPEETWAEVAKHVAVLRSWKGNSKVIYVGDAIEALIALVPEPAPEWPDEVVRAFIRSSPSKGLIVNSYFNRQWARKYLTNLHESGLDIRLREA